jgi:hypothetical protein
MEGDTVHQNDIPLGSCGKTLSQDQIDDINKENPSFKYLVDDLICPDTKMIDI